MDMKSDLLEAAMPRLELSPEEEFAITEEANHLINDTIASHDEFLAYGRVLPKDQWKRMKNKGVLTAYRTRRNFESAAPQLPQVKTSGSILDRFRASTMDVDTTSSEYSDPSSGSTGSSWSTWSSTGSMSSCSESWSVLGSMDHQQLSQMPMVVVTGIIAGTMEDAAYGNIADNPAVWKLRSTYTKDLHHRCKILTTLRQPSRDDPFRFLGVKWSLKKLPAFLSMRDMVYTECAGVIRDENGKIATGYNLMHSIELPGIPQLTRFGVQRFKISCCFITRPYDDTSIEIYCRAFAVSAGGLIRPLGKWFYAEALLAGTNIMECTHMKKLMWLTHQRRRHNIHYTHQSVETATHCQGCLRGLKILGGFTRSASTCQCCKRIVCGSCTTQRTVIVDLTEGGGVTQKALPFCAQCVAEAKGLPALDIALATTPL